MNPTDELRFVKAEEADVLPLSAIMVQAFEEASQQFRGQPVDHPPGYEAGEWLREWMHRGICYKIMKGRKIIGGFILIIEFPKSKYNYLGSIFVDSAHQNQGIGSRTLQFIEDTFPTKTWQTMTEAWATRNHHFYEKNGYRKVKEFYDKNQDQITYVYEKDMR